MRIDFYFLNVYPFNWITTMLATFSNTFYCIYRQPISIQYKLHLQHRLLLASLHCLSQKTAFLHASITGGGYILCIFKIFNSSRRWKPEAQYTVHQFFIVKHFCYRFTLNWKFVQPIYFLLKLSKDLLLHVFAHQHQHMAIFSLYVKAFLDVICFYPHISC